MRSKAKAPTAPVRLTFPEAADTGRAFTSIAHACAWLQRASAGEYGPASYVSDGRTMPFGTDPLRWSLWSRPVLEHPIRLEAVDTVERALELAAAISEEHPHEAVDDLGVVFARYTSADGTSTYATKHLVVPRPDYADLFLGQYLRLSAWTSCAQLDLPTAKRRAVQAARIAELSNAAALTALAFTSIANRWLHAAYADALTRAHSHSDVEVELTDRPARAGQLIPNPAGVVKLGY